MTSSGKGASKSSGKLFESEELAEQAANNTEQQFAVGDFKDVLTDIIIIQGQEAHNNIADQLLKDDRSLATIQGLLASMVFKAFAQARGSGAKRARLPTGEVQGHATEP